MAVAGLELQKAATTDVSNKQTRGCARCATAAEQRPGGGHGAMGEGRTFELPVRHDGKALSRSYPVLKGRSERGPAILH